MEKQNTGKTQGRRLVKATATCKVRKISRKMLYTPKHGIPIGECEYDEDGEYKLVLKKKIRGQDAVYEKYTLSEVISFLMEEWPR